MSETVATPNGAAAPPLKSNNPFEATSQNILSNTGVATKMASTFDRSMHQPFRLDHKGFNKDVSANEMAKKEGFNSRNLANEEAKIPTWWQKNEKTNPNRTLTDLQGNRRREFIPDISFDLDGDGIVGNRDLVISKLFDKDKDGRLNTNERKNAIEAIRNGIDDKMVWNVEQSGALRSFRIMQKRGVVLDNDDFLPVRATYPDHPTSALVPNARTMPELREQRRRANKDKIDHMNATFEQKRQKYQSVDRPYIYSEFNKGNKPRFTSIQQRKEHDRQDNRKKAELTNVIQDQKDEAKPPSLAFVDNPKIAAKSALEQHRRQQMANELKLLEGNVGNHADSYMRMNAREDCSLRVLSQMPPSKMTSQQLDQKRRAEMVADNTAKFGSVTIGIHGGELPKFAGDNGSKEWWRLQHAKKEDPQIQSRLLLKQTQQYWAKNDSTLLADMSHDVAPQDIFKMEHFPKAGIKEVPIGINKMVHCSDEALQKEPDVKSGYRNQISWSTQFNDTRCIGNDRTFDKIVARSKAREQSEIAREKKLQDYFSQPQRGTVRGRQEFGSVGAQPKDGYINRQENIVNPIQKNAINSNRSAAHAQSKITQGNRSASQLDTIETSVAKPNESVIVGGQKVANEQPLQFGFTTAGGMKSTLFSRMSPNAKGGPSGAGATTFNDAAKIARTQGSTQNMQTALQTNSQPQNLMSPAARTGAITIPSNSGGNRGARSPFRDAMQKGVLSGAGLLTH